MFRPRPTIVSELEQLIVQFKQAGCDSSETALQMLGKCQELTLSFQTVGGFTFGSEFTPTKTTSAPRGRPAKKKYDSDDSGSDSSSLSDSESEESVEESYPKKVTPKMAKPKKSFGGDGGSEESDSESDSDSGSSEEEPKIKPKKLLKKKKDPNAPRRPMTAYLLFCTEKREAYRREHPEARIMDIARALGEIWKASSDADKQVYQEKAQQEKLRYEEEMRQYQSKISIRDEPHDEEPKKKVASPMKKVSSNKKDTNASPVKRPKSAYMFFVTEKRNEVKAQHPEFGFADLTKQMAVMWKDMSEDTKKIWADKAAADMERYQRECAE